jgi:NAD(P)-dependent dehydrogenase (short-subunit alcohol dehydrogenase family)
VTTGQGDVSNLGDLDRLFAKIKQEKGKLDIVFANAGVAKLAPFPSAGSARPMRSPRRLRFSPPTTAVTSPVRSCSWTADSRKCDAR